MQPTTIELKAVLETKYKAPKMATITEENKWALNGTPRLGSMIDKYLENGKPLSLEKDQHNLACHVCDEMVQPQPVMKINRPKQSAPALLFKAW